MMYWEKTTISRIRRGYDSAVYFNRTKKILEQEHDETPVTMQVFQWNDGSVLCGMREAIELLREGVGFWHNHRWVSKRKTLTVSTLADGDVIGGRELVMHITGPYVYFAHGSNDFTADVVKVNGNKIAKVGLVRL